MLETAFCDGSHEFLLEKEISEILGVNTGVSGNLVFSGTTKAIGISNITFDKREIIEVFEIVDNVVFIVHF
jgi:hypothetical protein